LKCFFWVARHRRLYDHLFWAIHSMKEQNPPDVVALLARLLRVMFLPPPPPGRESASGPVLGIPVHPCLR